MGHKTGDILLGINHMFLYPKSMTDADTHTATLRELADRTEMDALDCWVWAEHAKDEINILRSCGKQINYNISVPIFMAAKEPAQKARMLDTLRRESDFALEAGAKKIIFGSGDDVPNDREGAKSRFVELILSWAEYIPEDVCLTLEPIDRDVDKRFLLGPLEDSCQCIERIRQAGRREAGILLDMGHIPLLHETMENAIEKTLPWLRHIHLANCILKNPENPLFGDKHVCWGEPDGEYDETDGVLFMRLLQKSGYLNRQGPISVSFEMRPLGGMNALQTDTYLKHWFWNTMAQIG